MPQIFVGAYKPAQVNHIFVVSGEFQLKRIYTCLRFNRVIAFALVVFSSKRVESVLVCVSDESMTPKFMSTPTSNFFYPLGDS